MEIGFNPAKDAINLEQHGVSLAFGKNLFDDPDHVIIASFRPIDGEDRYKVIGKIDAKLWTAVHVYRNTVTWFISVRRSNLGEKRSYDSYSSGP